MFRLPVFLILVPFVLSGSLRPGSLFANDLAKNVAAAEAGDFDAMLRVGIAFLSDENKGNNKDGIKWLEMSAAGGNVVAYYNLGANYQDGESVKQDTQKALMYLTIAAELGEVRAMNRLAGIYFVGDLVPTNEVLAVKWGLCAMELGSKTSAENVDKMMSQVEKRSAVLGGKAAIAWLKSRSPETK